MCLKKGNLEAQQANKKKAPTSTPPNNTHLRKRHMLLGGLQHSKVANEVGTTTPSG